MCLVVFNWRPDHTQPLLLAANRDEFYERPAKPFHWWPSDNRYDHGLLAGIDLKAKGTWMAFDQAGRFAILTNIRPGFVGVDGQRTRGEIPTNYIASGLGPYAFGLSMGNSIHHYAGFNLLLGEPGSLFWMSSNHRVPTSIEPGIHGLSNDSLDTPWPKVERAKEQMLNVTPDFEQAGFSTSLLTDKTIAPDHELPSTGVPLDWERLLSAQTITSDTYGTRSRCLFKIVGDEYHLLDQQLDRQGEVEHQSRFQWSITQG